MNRFLTASFFCSFLLAGSIGACPAASSAMETPVHVVRYDEDLLWYLNEATLVMLPDHIVSFWSRIVPRRDSASLREMRSVLARAGKDPRRLASIQRLDEVDCRSSRIRTLSTIFYDSKDRIVLSRSQRSPEWSPISPGSDDAVMHDAVCSGQRPAADILSAIVCSTESD